MKDLLLKAKDWLLPPNIFRLLTYYRPSAVYFALKHSSILAKNRTLHDRHLGERCFILASGTSLKEQNIKPLKNEIVFALNSSYLHADYEYISPQYHCLPQVTDFSYQITVERFREMQQKASNAEFFFAHQEMSIINENKLFTDRKVNYLCMGTHYFPNSSKLPSLTSIIPRVQSVPIMAILIALNMGFKEIYLLGVDHDFLITKEYKYCYEQTITKGKDISVNEDGTLKDGVLEQLKVSLKLWEQYRAIKKIALQRGVNIYNANPKSMLDEFEFVNLENVIKSSHTC